MKKQESFTSLNSRKANLTGFTLIEILVVVSIIGLLSSIVLVSVKSARDKARIAAGLQFAAQVHHALGDEAVGIWDFDENADNTCQGATAPYDDICDISGYGNHGQRNGATWVSGPDNTPSGKGYSLSFNGNNYINLGNPSTLQITGDQAISLWLKPRVLNNRRNPYAKAYGGEGTITQEPDGHVNYYYGTCGGNCSPYQGFTMTDRLKEGEWVHLVLVRDLSSTPRRLYWYKNGKLANQTGANYSAAASSTGIVYIGAGYVQRYDGLIDDVRIYTKALTQAQVQAVYAEGAAKHGLLAEKE